MAHLYKRPTVWRAHRAIGRARSGIRRPPFLLPLQNIEKQNLNKIQLSFHLGILPHLLTVIYFNNILELLPQGGANVAHLPAYVASAVSLVYTSPHALSDTHSVLDEAEKQRD